MSIINFRDYISNLKYSMGYIRSRSCFAQNSKEREQAMMIQVTPLAERKLKERLEDQPGFFKLFYDTEGCGCDGINVLLIVSEVEDGDSRIESDSLPFIVSR
jgi:hypothetical protein